MTDKQGEILKTLTVLQYAAYLYLDNTAGGGVPRAKLLSAIRQKWDISDRQLRRDVLTMIKKGVPVCTSHDGRYILSAEPGKVKRGAADLRAKASALWARADALENAATKWNGKMSDTLFLGGV